MKVWSDEKMGEDERIRCIQLNYVLYILISNTIQLQYTHLQKGTVPYRMRFFPPSFEDPRGSITLQKNERICSTMHENSLTSRVYFSLAILHMYWSSDHWSLQICNAQSIHCFQTVLTMMILVSFTVPYTDFMFVLNVSEQICYGNFLRCAYPYCLLRPLGGGKNGEKGKSAYDTILFCRWV